ncbi:MAG: class I SAM-dependent methyltransferase [Flavobacteriales bacterium]|nr:class I SAM-dependent methyltransferase [Flavobacteriales bacterium]
MKDRLKDIFQWEVRSWSRALPIWQRNLPKERPLKALGIGEREGGTTLWLALEGADVVCTDLRPFPTRTKEMHLEYGVSDRVTYSEADVLELPFPDNSFDVVIFKSVIGALSEKQRQVKALEEIHRVLTPGGVLLFAENLHGTRIHRWLRKRFVKWDHYWRYLDPITDLDLFAPFSRIETHTTGLFANLGRTEFQRDLIARIDPILLPMVPTRWHSILIGAAFK